MFVKRHALVSGATGIQGRALLQKLERSQEWGSIYAVSRHEMPDLKGTRVQHLPLNLTEEQSVKEGLKKATDVTHVFHLAFAGDTMNADTTAIMLYNIVEGLEAAGAQLQHVYFTQGAKYYGVHLTSNNLKTPFKESDPRHISRNFYYDMEDYVVRRRKEGVQWTWSALRPGAIIGYAPTSFMNLLHTVAVYGTLCKVLNLGAMRFPGTAEAYAAVTDAADTEVLANAQTCPLLLRVFPKHGAHHHLEEFAERGKEPKEEVQVYTWMDATLRELTELIQEVQPAARRQQARLEFALIYPDRRGRNVLREVGQTSATRQGPDDDKTLKELNFQTGDFMDVAIL